MTQRADPSVHASAVLVGDRAVLIRGPSGADKSHLAFDLIMSGKAGQIAPTQLVGDDRVYLTVVAGHLIVSPAPELAGLIEIRGLGIRRCDFAASGRVGLVVDLAAPDSARMPPEEALKATLLDVRLPRIPVSAGIAALPLVVAALTTTNGYSPLQAPRERLLEGN